MEYIPWRAIIVLVLIIIAGIIAFFALKVSKEEYKRTGKHPEGHYLGIGIAVGLPLGISMGIAMGYMGIGPAIGLSVGVAIGAALEKKHAHELRPLTKKEEKFRNINMLCLGIFAVFGVIVFLIVAFF